MKTLFLTAVIFMCSIQAKAVQQGIPLLVLTTQTKVLLAVALAEKIAKNEVTYGPAKYVQESTEDARLTLCMKIGDVGARAGEILELAKDKLTAREHEGLHQ